MNQRHVSHEEQDEAARNSTVRHARAQNSVLRGSLRAIGGTIIEALAVRWI